MAKKSRRNQEIIFDQPRKTKDLLTPRTDAQASLIHEITHRDLTFALGPAGTGKTYVITHMACDMLKSQRVKKIIVTRPMITSEEDIGFLPGEVDEKFAPYFAPVREIMDDRLGRSHVDNLVRNRRIEIAPIGFLRGHTFRNAFVIFDEAQNTTRKQMQLFLTRIGEKTKVCVDGDLDQMDIPAPSGLEDAVHRFTHLPEVGTVEFTADDVCRSGLARKIVTGYSK